MSARPEPEEAHSADTHPLMARAVSLHKEGHLAEAAEAYLHILKEAPRNFDATHLLGVVALQQGRFEAAHGLINKALSINPHDVVAMGNLGTSYMRDGKLEAALHWFQIALQLQPDSLNAITNVGTILHHMGRTLDAIPIMRKAYVSNVYSYELCNLLGACLIKHDHVREAAEVFEAATRAEPNNAEGWANRSVALNAMGEHSQARECADKAVALKPESTTALGALGAAQYDQGRLSEAIESYRQGVALPGPSAQMLMAFGNALIASGLNEEAIVQLERVVKLDEQNLNARWAIALAQLKPIYQDEADLKSSREKFSEALDQVALWYKHATNLSGAFDAVGTSQPFFLAYQPFNNRELMRRYGALCATWMATHPAAANALPIDGVHRLDDKIRIGIASAHIHEHSVWNAITKGWIDHIDRDKFELYLYQLSPTADSETDRVRGVVTGFEDRPSSVTEWVQAIKGQSLDVLIYPEIGMDPLTVRLASLRLAPIQAASWGHPESTGLPTMDIYLSAAAFEPANSSENYSETVTPLPNLGVYVEALDPPKIKLSLRSLDLPSDEPLLLCPGSPFKYTPQYDYVWVEIARQLRKKLFSRSSGGRLVFFRSRSDSLDKMLETRLRSAFKQGGVDFDKHVRIIPTLDRPRFFGLMRHSAVLLDTLGFSGFNTALQAIECDLPVLAFEGEFMRGRLASGILRQLDLDELVARNPEEFVSKAIVLAGDASRRKELRTKIRARRHVLFEDLAPIRELERQLTRAVTNKRASNSIAQAQGHQLSMIGKLLRDLVAALYRYVAFQIKRPFAQIPSSEGQAAGHNLSSPGSFPAAIGMNDATESALPSAPPSTVKSIFNPKDRTTGRRSPRTRKFTSEVHPSKR